ncbi:hypothetical protein EYS14_19775 [Alteromonadaceae bacterium M269]|nr:hypothetical protein EYS14_19775 [Alteromonadaceae bacterium M269]
MNNHLMLWPLLVQVLLTIFIFIVLAKRKKQSIADGTANREAAALDNKAWPEDVVKASNNIENQFQTPVLFYALCLAFVVNNGVTAITLSLAWVYAVSRIAHAYIHVGSNYVPKRLRYFMIGVVSLIAMAVILGLQLAGLY